MHTIYSIPRSPTGLQQAYYGFAHLDSPKICGNGTTKWQNKSITSKYSPSQQNGWHSLYYFHLDK